MASPSVEQLVAQVSHLKLELEEERQLREQAVATAVAALADKSRLQRARDELATALLVAEKRAQDAEEEQLRAEEQAAGLTRQLQQLQQDSEAAAAALGRGTAPEQGGQAGGDAQAAQQRQQQQQQSMLPASSTDRGLQRDIDVLLAELDKERRHSEELVRALDAAEREAAALAEQLLAAQRSQQQGNTGYSSSTGRGPVDGTSADGSGRQPGSVRNGGAAAAAVETVAHLQERVARLRASRDKLIGALDAQAAEVERLSVDNAVLAEALVRTKDVAAKWEAQAQDCLAQNELLKGLLEESATWGLPSQAAPPGGTGGAGGAEEGSSSGSQPAAHQGDGAGTAAATAPATSPAAGGSGTGVTGSSGNHADLATLCQRFERDLLLEKARSAQLDMQVRALCMELTRAAHSGGALQAALLPLLGGIETRLTQVLGMKPRTATAAELLPQQAQLSQSA